MTFKIVRRAFPDEKKAKMGVVECVNHKLIEPFNVLYEKEGKNWSINNAALVTYFLSIINTLLGEYVAQFKFTVLLMPSGSHKITGLPFHVNCYESEHSVKDESIKVLNFIELYRKITPLFLCRISNCKIISIAANVELGCIKEES